MELTKRFRPKVFKHVFGQPNAIKVLNNFFKRKEMPHFLLFSGPTGTGKTTLARITAQKLGCSELDMQEHNCAEWKKPIDSVRDINNYMGLAPMQGAVRVYILDEVQALSRTKFAQQALLKILEEPPDHAYFMLATTDPSKLILPIRNRGTPILTRNLNNSEMTEFLGFICSKIKFKLEEEAQEAIISSCEGSPRQALVMLDAVVGITDPEEQLRAIHKADVKHLAIEIARVLFNPRARWPNMKTVLESVDEDPESLRHMILGYSSKILLSGGKLAPRAYMIIQAFSDPYYDVGKPGLIASCWEVIGVKK